MIARLCAFDVLDPSVPAGTAEPGSKVVGAFRSRSRFGFGIFNQ